ncbi:MAG: hypothetical protein JSS32_06785 [Verrucomicrobia bacterium]|nr:hypothetical protein [Verrucomicrobiota bacterium]
MSSPAAVASPAHSVHSQQSSFSFDSQASEVIDLAKPLKDLKKEKINFANRMIMLASAILAIAAAVITGIFSGNPVLGIVVGGATWALLYHTTSAITETILNKYLPKDA